VNPDRRVHAHAHKHAIEVVRYEKAGKWFLEEFDIGDETVRTPLTIERAVWWALLLQSHKGTILHGVPGGKVFDRKVRTYPLRRKAVRP
jgi:hypothetical protein